MRETWGKRSVHVARWSWNMSVSPFVNRRGALQNERFEGIGRLLKGGRMWLGGLLRRRRPRSSEERPWLYRLVDWHTRSQHDLSGRHFCSSNSYDTEAFRQFLKEQRRKSIMTLNPAMSPRDRRDHLFHFLSNITYIFLTYMRQTVYFAFFVRYCFGLTIDA